MSSGGGGQFSKSANDDDDVASFSKNSKTRVSTSCLTAATGKIFPIPGLSKRGKEKKEKNKLPLLSSIVAIVQQEWSRECSFFLVVFFLFF